MLLVLPVCERDVNLLVGLLPLLKRFGPYGNHRALLVFAPQMPDEVKKSIIASLKEMSFQAVHRATPMLNHWEEGWPAGPNGMFRATVELIFNELILQQPWYFFEPDNTPMKKGWLDVLERQWRMSEDRPFLGSIQPTLVAFENGETMQTGAHMVGTGIYPPDLDRYCDPLNTQTDEPFDIRLGEATVGNDRARDTRLIQHNWSSIKYRRDSDGVIRCERGEVRQSNMVGAPIVRDVDAEALVVHGCKDGSLCDLILSETDENGSHVKSIDLARKLMGVKHSEVEPSSADFFEP